MCDIILASPTAKFGQPEINLGVIPGGGGSQRLTHAIGKSRAMEIILTGRQFSALEAEQWGVVSKVVEEGEGQVVKEAVAMAKVIASKSQIAVQAAKEVVNAAYELSLPEGLRFERRIFHGMFATNDQKEGELTFNHYHDLLTSHKYRHGGLRRKAQTKFLSFITERRDHALIKNKLRMYYHSCCLYVDYLTSPGRMEVSLFHHRTVNPLALSNVVSQLGANRHISPAPSPTKLLHIRS